MGSIGRRLQRLEANRRAAEGGYEIPPYTLLYLKHVENARREMDGLEPVPHTAEEEELEAEHDRELLESDCYGLRDDPGWQSPEARAMLDHWERDAREDLERYRKEKRG
jgi:hypothetical protein